MPKDRDDPARRLDHDAEETVRKGMSVEGEEVDQAETLASTGDLESSFQEIGRRPGSGSTAPSSRPARNRSLTQTGPSSWARPPDAASGVERPRTTTRTTGMTPGSRTCRRI